MKCPKCGYNSFEIHDTCKKCAHDLTGYKDIHGLKSIVLPHETRTSLAEKLMAEKAEDTPSALVEAPADMFSFAVTESETTIDAGFFLEDDPFDFGDEPDSTSLGGGDVSFGKRQMSKQVETEEDVFADLFESAPHYKGGPPSTLQPEEADTRAGLDLNDFIWDDTPDTAPGEMDKTAVDDFNILFGDTDDTAKK